eukprot:1145465-Heterocapsa_arctica.AAC.1
MMILFAPPLTRSLIFGRSVKTPVGAEGAVASSCVSRYGVSRFGVACAASSPGRLPEASR